MTIADTLIKILDTSPPPPPYGWLNELPEAFAAVDEQGEVTVIGYKGEWYVPVKPSLRVRLRNWLIRFDEVEPDANPGWRKGLVMIEPGDRVIHINVRSLPGTVRSVNLGIGEYPYRVQWDNGLWSLNSHSELEHLT